MSVAPTKSLDLTVIGGGLIGCSWAALFLAHGHRVCVHDVAGGASARVQGEVQRLLPFLQRMGVPFTPSLADLRFDPQLGSAVREADIVQECGPERISFKQSLWAEVEAHCGPETLLLSSSSGIPASMQARRMASPQRMLIGHPFNPPHLVPLVEVVPGRKTSEASLQRACGFYGSLGKRAIRLNKEIPGFVANRIQAAVIRESLFLVKHGVVTVEDLDAAVENSLGLRWACTGPLRSMHLGGGAGGIKGYLQQFGTGLQLLWLHMSLRSAVLTRATQCRVGESIQRAYGTRSIESWSAQRDLEQVAVLHSLKQEDDRA